MPEFKTQSPRACLRMTRDTGVALFQLQNMIADTFECPLTGCIVAHGKLQYLESTPQIRKPPSTDYNGDDDGLELASTMERAKNGNAEAMYAIGNWYYRGAKGLAKSPRDAHWWWERACEHQPERNSNYDDELGTD